MKAYVVGFAYTDFESVLVIRKLKPAWQRGALNGIGGKIEPGENPAEAMQREAMEEAGLSLRWECRGTICGYEKDGEKYEVHVFYAFDPAARFFHQREEEKLQVMKIADVLEDCHVKHLEYLLPFGLCSDPGKPRILVCYNREPWGEACYPDCPHQTSTLASVRLADLPKPRNYGAFLSEEKESQDE